MQHALHRDVERVARLARDDRLGKGVAQAGAAGAPRDVLLRLAEAVNGVVDGAIARAAAQVAFEHARQIVARVCVVEGGRRHDHARRAEAALKGLGIEKRLLHGMQLPSAAASPSMVVTVATGRAKCGSQAGMDGVPSSQTVQAPQSP